MRYLVLCFLFFTGCAPTFLEAHKSVGGAIVNDSEALFSKRQTRILRNNPGIPPEALKQALAYLKSHSDSISNQNYLTIVNFDLPSTEKRMFVIDLHSSTSESYFAAHGKGSGENYAATFSNEINSGMTSLGFYLTGDQYTGNDGVSLQLHGLQSSNSNAFARAVVMHGAAYVSQDFINHYGRLGRSLGCPAVELQYVAELIEKLKNGSLLYHYHSPTERPQSQSLE